MTVCQDLGEKTSGYIGNVESGIKFTGENAKWIKMKWPRCQIPT